MENLERIVAKGPDTKLIRQCRETARKEDKRSHSEQYPYHARETIERFVSAYSGRWHQLNEAAGAVNAGETMDNHAVAGLIRGFGYSESWLRTYRKKGSILAVLGTEGYRDFAMLAREGLVLVTRGSESFYQLHQS